MNCLIEARGVIDKNTLTEIRTYLAPAFARLFTIILGAVYSFLAFIHVPDSLPTSVFYLVAAFVFYIMYKYNMAAVVKQYLDILDVLYNTQRLAYFLSFQEEALCFTIQGEEDHPIYISYSDFNKIIETRNCYLMVDGGRIPVIIEKNTVNISKEKWRDFLFKKCINVEKIKFIK